MFFENFKHATHVLSYLHELGLFINIWITKRIDKILLTKEARLPEKYPFTIKSERDHTFCQREKCHQDQWV